MTAESVVTAALMANATVAAAIADRIYVNGKVPQGAVLPYLTYQRIGSSGGEVDLDGDPSPDRVRLQINVQDAMFNGDAMGLAMTIRNVLHGRRGDGAQLITCTPPVDFDPEEKLKIEGARLDAIVTIQEAAAAA